MTRKSGSVPDLSLTQEGTQDQESKGSGSAQYQPMRATTFDELYYKHIGFRGGHHHHPSHRQGGRRARRSREYDSDTGCKSDRDVYVRSHRGRDSPRAGGASSEILSVRSQPNPHNHHRRHSHGHGGSRGKGKEGYASDVGPYSSPAGAGLGSLFPTANAAAAAFQQNKTRSGLVAGQSPHGSNSDLLFQQPGSQAMSSSSPSGARSTLRTQSPASQTGPHQPGSKDYGYHHPQPYVRRTSEPQNMSHINDRIPVSASNQDYQSYYHNNSNSHNQQATPSSHQQHSGFEPGPQSLPQAEQTQIQPRRQLDSGNMNGVIRPPVAPKPKLNSSLPNGTSSNRGNNSPVLPSPGFHSESFVDQSTPTGTGNPGSVQGALNSPRDARDTDLYTLMEGNRQNQNLVSRRKTSAFLFY